MRAQRDTYANLNNGVLHLANQGVAINQIHKVYAVPMSLQMQWAVSMARSRITVVQSLIAIWAVGMPIQPH
jgi:alkyl sulfatase BDS1-like metallo-beta-lactamase superfamily hydrolase